MTTLGLNRPSPPPPDDTSPSKKALTGLRHDVLTIGVPGAIGGVVAWLLTLRAGPLVNPMIDFPLCVIAGAVAAFITVAFALGNNPQDTTRRIVACSFIAGIGWEPILAQAAGLNAPRRDLVQSESRFDALEGAVAALIESSQEDEDKTAAQDASTTALELLQPLIDEPAADDTESEVSAPTVDALRDAALDRLDEQRQADIITRFDWDDLPRSEGGPYFSSRIERIVPNFLFHDSDALLDVPQFLDIDSPYEYTADDEQVWIVAVTVTSTNYCRFETIGPVGADLVASLYDDTGGIIVVDDDGLGDLNPLLRPPVRLQPGEYYLRVSQYQAGQTLPDFNVNVDCSVRAAPADDVN